MVVFMKSMNYKQKYRFWLLLTILLVVLIYYLSGLSFFRIDLTSEKKYTLSSESKEILNKLDDIVYIKVYLDGDLPTDLVRFRQDIEEHILELKAWAGRFLEYEFINLYEEENTEVRNQMMQQLAEKGLRITDVQLRDDEGGITTKIIFPGAVISYGNIEFPVNLLKNNPALPYQENLKNSVESLEYEFIRAIKSITTKSIEKVAFIEGHGELDFYETYDISTELSLFFQVDRGELTGDLDQVLDYRALIIAQPKSRFSESEKFILDQYLMNGGNLLFFLDPVEANEDSLINGQTFTQFRDLNIYDLLFKYGIRISYNLIKDLQCNFKRVQTSVNQQEPVTRIFPWWYSPLLTAPDRHMLTRGLNYIKTDYVSAIDTTQAAIPGLKRTVLLSSSDTSALVENPVYISMEEITRPPEKRIFNQSGLPVAILAEGTFPSFFRNYGIPDGVNTSDKLLKDKGTGNLFVSGDGDMIRNEVLVRNRELVPQPLGYDRDTRQTFGNKDFIMNVVNFMTGDKSLIQLRSREFKLRLLDRSRIRIKEVRLKWLIINTLIPPLIVLLLGLFYNWRRKKKYSRKAE
jgi:ABC-2 type transport system permease protein